MKLHHLGYACQNIVRAIKQLQNTFNVLEISETVYDPLQKASVCMLTLEDHSRIELISGECVKNILNGSPLQFYHVCYEVDSIGLAIAQFVQNQSFIISDKKPAKLFDNRYATFLQTPLGIIELIESQQHPHTPDYFISSTFNIAPIDTVLNEYQTLSTKRISFALAEYNTLMLDLLNLESVLYSNQYSVYIFIIRLVDFIQFKNTDQTHENALVENCNLILDQAKKLNPESHYYFIIAPSFSDEEQASIADDLAQLENILVTEINKLHYCAAMQLSTCQFKITQLNETAINDETHIPYKQFMYQLLGYVILGRIYHYQIPSYKLIVVDCDNTIWSGICSEAQEAITIEPHNHQLQTLLTKLSSQGFLIALVSKNIEKDVLNAFSRQMMSLTLDHICDYEINFSNKSDSIKVLCQRLDIALDSVIFIDDNPIEIAEVESALGISTLHFTAENASLLQYYWPFIKWKTTKEDQQRTANYQQQTKRVHALEKSESLESFLTNLALEVKFQRLDPQSIDRLKQLLLRTNQFNMTKSDYLPNSTCELFTVSDRFGDYGISGGILYHVESERFVIDNLFMSCRVLQRNVERHLLQRIILLCQHHHAKKIDILFKATQRNIPAKNFLLALHPESVTEKNSYINYHYFLEHLLMQENKLTLINTATPTTNAITVSSLQDQQTLKISFERLCQFAKKPQQQEIPVNKNAIDTKQIIDFITAQLLEMAQIESLSADRHILHIIDSLQATQLISKIMEYYNAPIKLFDIYQYQTIAAFAEEITRKIPITNQQQQPNSVATQSPVTALQEWLWIQNSIYNGSWYYNMPFYYRIKGKLDIKRLEAAFNMLINNHPNLRTYFNDDDNQILQYVLNDCQLHIEVFDAEQFDTKSLNAQLDQHSLTIIPLDQAPLMKVGLFKRGPEEYILSFVIHHIIADGWSYPLIYKELEHHYKTGLTNSILKQGETQIQIAKREREQQNTKGNAPHVAYWANTLANIKPICLAKQKNVAYQPFVGKYYSIELGDDLTNQIFSYCSTVGSTLFEYFLSCHAWFIWQQTHIDDFVILTPISGRDRGNINETIGCFVNLLPIHYHIEMNSTLESLLKQTKHYFKQALRHSHLCFQHLLAELFKINKKFGDANLFQAMLSYQNLELFSLKLDGLDISSYRRGYNAARLDLILELDNTSSFDGIVGGYYYNTSKYSLEEIKEYSTQYRRIIESSLQNVKERIA